MTERMDNNKNTVETHGLEQELDRWREYQLTGESLDDPEMVVQGMVRQIEYFYHLDRPDEARAFLFNIPDIIDLDQPRVRELIADTYTMVDDVDYYHNWYKENLFQRGANAGDQILIYGLLCHNKNSEAREVFDKVFPALDSPRHYSYALGHIPQLITDPSQRTQYYQAILEKSRAAVTTLDEQAMLPWYEVSLQAQYSLKDIPGFESTAQTLSQSHSGSAQQHLTILERLKDISNPRWRQNKIFGIGLSKTGTSSLSKALAMLGFSSAHWTNPYSRDLLTMDDIPLFDSLTDTSISHQYKAIYEKYPNAKFVLTTRSVDQWEKSFLTHYSRSLHASDLEDLRRIITEQQPPRFGQKYVDIHQDLYLRHTGLPEAYHAHEQGIYEFFKGREEQLLTLDVAQPAALQQLSSFLSVDCPQDDFPYTNTKKEKSSWVSPISGVTRKYRFKST